MKLRAERLLPGNTPSKSTAINFPFSTAFAASHEFWYVVFLFLFSQSVFNFSYDFYFDILVV